MRRFSVPSIRFATALFLFLLSLGRSAKAHADLLNGFAEWDYSDIRSSTGGAGGSTSSTGRAFMQRYGLNTDLRLFPTLNLSAGGTWQKENDATVSNGVRSSSATTTLRPFADLSLRVDPLSVTAGFSRRQEDDSLSNSPGSSMTTDDYHATVSLRLHDLPSATLQLNHTNRNGSGAQLMDATDDRASLSLHYVPLKELDLRAQSLYTSTTDHLQDLQVRQFTNTGRGTYGGDFFNRRVTVYSSLSVSREDTETRAGGKGGQVALRVDQLATGLYAATDTPTTGGLQPRPGLTNGDIAASAGIDSLGVPTPPAPATPRNIGFDFINPTDVSSIYVFIDRELPAAIAGSFSWDVYSTQDDPLSATAGWTLVTTVPAAQFGAYLNGWRFQIDFPQTRARGMKVVVRPLTPVAAALVPTFQNPDRIFVTEIQAFLVKAAGEVRGTTSQTSELGTMDVKVRLVDGVYYDGSVFFSHSASYGYTRYTLSNGLIAQRRLATNLTGTAQIAREDGQEAGGERSAYVYSVSLKATPLPALTDSLVYSGRNETVAGKRSGIQSVNLYNTAELYPGVNLTLSAGGSLISPDTGGETRNLTGLAALSLIPHRTLTVNLDYSANLISGGSGASRQTQRADASAAWRPFPTVYLFGSFGVVSDGQRTDTLTNYGVNWAPFPDGAFQLTFAYNENLNSRDGSKERLITPGFTWKVTSWSQLEGSYVMTHSEAETQTADTQIGTVTYRILF